MSDTYKLHDTGWHLKIAFTVVSSIVVHLSALIALTQFHAWKISETRYAVIHISFQKYKMLYHIL